MNKGFYWHIHHDKLVEWCFDYEERVDFIKHYKDKSEIELRLKLFQPVKGDLPKEFIEARQKYDEEMQKYDEARQKYIKARQKYDEEMQKYIKARQKYDEARQKYYETRQKYDEEIKFLHEQECLNCPWDGKTIFTKG